MWDRILIALLRRLIRAGTLELTLPEGDSHVFGDGTEPRVKARITTTDAVRAIVRNPELGVGEAYMDEQFVIEEGSLHDFFHVAISNMNDHGVPSWWRVVEFVRDILRPLSQFSPISRSQKNVGHHYDISTELYDLFLSPDRMYSCAYFKTDGMSLDEAQAAKLDHIARKLLLKPGARVLDIGCGWGHAACEMAERYDVHVTGVALSQSQIDAAQALAESRGLTDKVTFRYQDYRHVTGRFDAIYSIGMLEHVGLPHYLAFFRKVFENLADDGVALIHFIARARPPAATSPWITKYIFPGGYTPAISEISKDIEKSGLVPCDIEVWRGHYERTLNHWWQRFEANAAKAETLYDARFVRMWRYYLNASEMSFRTMNLNVLQYQLARTNEAVPRARDYMHDAPAKPKRSPRRKAPIAAAE